jgi:hypothetical protein
MTFLIFHDIYKYITFINTQYHGKKSKNTRRKER